MERHIIAENIHTNYEIILIALPPNNIDLIKVATSPTTILGGTFYYNDGTAEILDINKEIKKAISPEIARIKIPDIDLEKDKISFTYTCGASEYFKKKLSDLTVWDYYNKKW